MNSLPVRFWQKVQRLETGCWIWTAATNHSGYGIFGVGRRSVLAHRLVYEERHGTIPPGKLLRHACDKPACVNPDHLLVGTDLDNMRDSIQHRRRASFAGVRNPRRKLTAQQVVEIRSLYVPGQVRIVDLGTKFGVSKSQIWNIVSGREWNEYPEVKR